MMPGAIGDRVSPRVPPLVAPLVCGLCRRTVDDEMCRGMRYENDRSAHRKCMVSETFGASFVYPGEIWKDVSHGMLFISL